MNFILDLDAFLERQRQIERNGRQKRLNVTCPHCHTAVLEELEESAHASDGGYGPKASTMFECPYCEEEIEFNLEWDTVLWSARPVVKEPAGGI